MFGLDRFINEFIYLENNNVLPNKILLSGYKGIGKSTLAYHLINYILSKNEKFNYNTTEFKINSENQTFKTTIHQCPGAGAKNHNPHFIANSNPEAAQAQILHYKKSIFLCIHIAHEYLIIDKTTYNLLQRNYVKRAMKTEICTNNERIYLMTRLIRI